MHALGEGSPVDHHADLGDASLGERAAGADEFDDGIETELIERKITVSVALADRGEMGFDGGVEFCVTKRVELEQCLAHAGVVVDPRANA